MKCVQNMIISASTLIFFNDFAYSTVVAVVGCEKYGGTDWRCSRFICRG